mmetsp:Transcript_97932/g.281355  ORF Transcript_97932/g.281355 Transcript_97932/m.281355 type:complete len:213 (-) Transcript_97932:101-739(-)
MTHNGQNDFVHKSAVDGEESLERSALPEAPHVRVLAAHGLPPAPRPLDARSMVGAEQRRAEWRQILQIRQVQLGQVRCLKHIVEDQVERILLNIESQHGLPPHFIQPSRHIWHVWCNCLCNHSGLLILQLHLQPAAQHVCNPTPFPGSILPCHVARDHLQTRAPKFQRVMADLFQHELTAAACGAIVAMLAKSGVGSFLQQNNRILALNATC